MKILVTRTIGLKQKILKNVLEQLMPFSGPMQYIEFQKPLMFEENYFLWEDFFEVCSKFRLDNSINDDDFLIVLTELSNSGNWFSVYNQNGERTIFIQTTEWENYIYCEPVFPISFEIIANIFQSIMFKDLELNQNIYIHEPPIGCMNDMCSWKPDISFKLRTADICQDCQKLLLYKVSLECLKQGIEIFERLRKKIVFNSNYQRNQSFEENLPFTIAITKRKLGITSEPFRKLLMLIDHFDSIIRTSVIVLSHLLIEKENIVNFFKENNLSERPSLGHWEKSFASLVRKSKSKDWEINLPQDFSEKLKEVIKISNEGKIVMIRNEQRAHGYLSCHDNTYKETFKNSLPILEEMEKLLSPLFLKFKFFHILNICRSNNNTFIIDIHNLTGSNPAFLEEQININFTNIESIPIHDHVYFVSKDLKEWYDLYPYLIYRECPECHHNRLLVSDGECFLDPYIGHRVKFIEN